MALHDGLLPGAAGYFSLTRFSLNPAAFFATRA